LFPLRRCVLPHPSRGEGRGSRWGGLPAFAFVGVVLRVTWRLDSQHYVVGTAGWGCSPGSSSSSFPSCFMSGTCGPCLVVVRRRGPCGWLHSGWPSFLLAAVVVGCCRHWPLSFSLAIVFVGRHLRWLSSLAVTVCWVGRFRRCRRWLLSSLATVVVGHCLHWPSSSLAVIFIGCHRWPSPFAGLVVFAAVVVGYCRRWPLSFSLAIIFVGRRLRWLSSLAVTVCWVGRVQLPSWLGCGISRGGRGERMRE